MFPLAKFLSLAALALLAPSHAAGSYARNLTSLINAPDARCMDGTTPGYYLHAGTGAGRDKWIIMLQGGGECVRSDSCQQKAKSSLGSSKYFPAQYDFFSEAATHFVDADCKGNPDLCDYNLVFVPYCSQDLWSGTKTEATAATYGFYFSGHLIFSAVLDALDDAIDGTAPSLKNATSIVLSGESAGGFGVYNNIDWLASRYEQARVVGAPIAGYEFYAWPYTGPGHTSSSLADFRAAAMESGAYVDLWGAKLPSKCVAAHPSDRGACQLPCFSYSYIEAPLFIVEAQSDSVVLMYHDWLPQLDSSSLPLSPAIEAYMAQFAANQSTCLAGAMAAGSKDGVFNPACFIHTGFKKEFEISGMNYLTAFASWLGGNAVKLADNCAEGTVLCNPSCPL